MAETSTIFGFMKYVSATDILSDFKKTVDGHFVNSLNRRLIPSIFFCRYKKSQPFADLVIDSMMEYGCIITDRFKYITTTFIVFNDGWQSFNCRSFRT